MPFPAQHTLFRDEKALLLLTDHFLTTSKYFSNHLMSEAQAFNSV
jgi:hypothetical protein